MIVVRHRRNTSAMLAATDPADGAEIDLRWRDGRLVLAHDPGEDGEPFEAWLQGWRHRLLVANTKEEGIVGRVLETLDRHGVTAFVLGPDPGEALPFWRAGDRRIAVRVSEIHPPAMALGLARYADWAWVDSFDDLSLDAADHRALKVAGLRTCLVSPELYGRDTPIDRFRARAGRDWDAVCARDVAAWR